jgi:hypothetical protein
VTTTNVIMCKFAVSQALQTPTTASSSAAAVTPSTDLSTAMAALHLSTPAATAAAAAAAAATATVKTTAAGVSAATSTADYTADTTAGACTDSVTAETAAIRAKLLAFYKQHNPEKVDEVDTILQRYAGRTDAMFAKLYAKYGVTADVSHDVSNAQQLMQSDESTAVLSAEQTDSVRRDVAWFWRIEASTRCSIGVEQPASTGEQYYWFYCYIYIVLVHCSRYCIKALL